MIFIVVSKDVILINLFLNFSFMRVSSFSYLTEFLCLFKKTPQLWKCLKPFDFWKYHSLIKHTDKTIFLNILAKFLVIKMTILLTFLSRMKGDASECVSERTKK